MKILDKTDRSPRSLIGAATGGPRCLLLGAGLLVCVALGGVPAWAEHLGPEQGTRKQLIPILATALDQRDQPVGVVAELEVRLESRNDHNGMDVRFHKEPGRFSRTAQVAVVAAIMNIARVAKVNTDSWTVSLSLPNRRATVYGSSLSAMVGLTVLALSQGEVIQPRRVLTGTIDRNGQIGPVGGIALKLKAAKGKHLHRVLVPQEYDVTDGDWSTPFLLHVSPVNTVNSAYQALTDRSFPQFGSVQSGHAGRRPAGLRDEATFPNEPAAPR